LAATFGRRYEWALIASLSESLAGAAVKNGYYSDARKYYLKSLAYGPLSTSRWANFLVTLGGRYFTGRRANSPEHCSTTEEMTGKIARELNRTPLR